MTDDASAEAAIQKLNGISDRRRVFRDLSAVLDVPVLLAEDLADEHDAAISSFEAAKTKLKQEVQRVFYSGENGDFVGDGTVKHRLGMAAQ